MPTGGFIAFLFTDIEGSSLRWLNHRAAMEKAVARHDEIIQEVVNAHAGEVFKAGGDAFYVAFARPADAVNAAVAAQRDLRAEDFSAVEGLKVRMAVHVGSAERRGNDFFGPALNRTARLLELAHGGQILVTASLPELLAAERDVDAGFVRVGMNPLDDPAQPVGIFQVAGKNLPADFPPLRTAKTRLAALDPVVPKPSHATAKIAALAALGVVVAGLATIPFWRKPAGPMALARVTPLLSEKSIAVLPFDNLSKDEENAFFANGMQDEILTDLSRIADLKVISRSSVMQYKSGVPRNLREIAPALGVVYILEGSVQRAGGKVRVTAQLIDARTDAHVWAERYDRELADVFGIQSEIAERIAAQLRARLSDSERAAIAKAPTRDLVAYDLYLRAQQLIRSGVNPSQSELDNQQAVRWLNEAVARDPGFFAAWCTLANRHDFTYFSGSDRTPARLALAQSAVDTVVRLRPDAGETHLALALHYYWGFRDYERARQELELARRSLPNNADVFYFTGLIDRRQGRWDESNRNMERALELDPRNSEVIIELAFGNYGSQRRSADSIRTLNRLRTVRPDGPDLPLMLAQVELDQTANLAPMRALVNSLLAGPAAKDPSVAAAALDLALRERDGAAAAAALLAITGGEVKPVFWAGNWFPHAYFVGRIAQLRGDPASAGEAFEAARVEMEATVSQQPENVRALVMLAMINTELTRKEEALRAARRACEMLPIEKDAMYGAELFLERARIESRSGETDVALEHLKLLSERPSALTYGDLMIDASWDSLRGEPRFQALAEKLAPKGAKP